MADQWYYWHDADVLGPFSGKQLFDLAATGGIVPTDTIWKEGVEGGIQASRVQHLFPVVPESQLVGGDLPMATAAPSAESPAKAPAEDEGKAPAVKPPESVSRWDSGSHNKGGKSRAVAGKGVVIMGQDGTNVKFKKKCTTCGYEDSSMKTMAIARGTTRVVFFCQKCKKQRHVEINGFIG